MNSTYLKKKLILERDTAQLTITTTSGIHEYLTEYLEHEEYQKCDTWKSVGQNRGHWKECGETYIHKLIAAAERKKVFTSSRFLRHSWVVYRSSVSALQSPFLNISKTRFLFLIQPQLPGIHILYHFLIIGFSLVSLAKML